jgi:hypothetical protein
LFFGGLFLFAVGVGLFFFFGHLEQQGGNVRMPAIILGIYKLTGKWGILIICSLLGACGVGAGIVSLVKGDPKAGKKKKRRR